MKTTLLCALLVILGCEFALGQAQYKVLYNLAGGPSDGANPIGALVFDSVGNLYGTTSGGGTSSSPACAEFGCGTVFELSPNVDGTWSEKVIYSFCSKFSELNCQDGSFPQAGLVLDATGNLYGMTSKGGGRPCPLDTEGCGTIFELSPPSSHATAWKYSVLYRFCAIEQGGVCKDGDYPLGRLALDSSGKLYGTTRRGGAGHGGEGNLDGGTVFELSPSGGRWTESVLYSFCSFGTGNYCPDGAAPEAGVTFDESGNIYGTTAFGGASFPRHGYGTVYELSPGSNEWNETVLYAPLGNGGVYPRADVSFDRLGNLFSTFLGGRPDGDGGVFRIGPHGGVTATPFNGEDGDTPTSGVLIDARRAVLYGTTPMGGAASLGVIYKIVPPSQESVLHSFCSLDGCADGGSPEGSLIEDRLGNLYGATTGGGAYNEGVVFEITP